MAGAAMLPARLIWISVLFLCIATALAVDLQKEDNFYTRLLGDLGKAIRKHNSKMLAAVLAKYDGYQDGDYKETPRTITARTKKHDVLYVPEDRWEQLRDAFEAETKQGIIEEIREIYHAELDEEEEPYFWQEPSYTRMFKSVAKSLRLPVEEEEETVTIRSYVDKATRATKSFISEKATEVIEKPIRETKAYFKKFSQGTMMLLVVIASVIVTSTVPTLINTYSSYSWSLPQGADLRHMSVVPCLISICLLACDMEQYSAIHVASILALMVSFAQIMNKCFREDEKSLKEALSLIVALFSCSLVILIYKGEITTAQSSWKGWKDYIWGSQASITLGDCIFVLQMAGSLIPIATLVVILHKTVDRAKVSRQDWYCASTARLREYLSQYNMSWIGYLEMWMLVGNMFITCVAKARCLGLVVATVCTSLAISSWCCMRARFTDEDCRWCYAIHIPDMQKVPMQPSKSLRVWMAGSKIFQAVSYVCVLYMTGYGAGYMAGAVMAFLLYASKMSTENMIIGFSINSIVQAYLTGGYVAWIGTIPNFLIFARQIAYAIGLMGPQDLSDPNFVEHVYDAMNNLRQQSRLPAPIPEVSSSIEISETE